MKTGKQLKMLRVERDLTQEELGKKSGLSKTTIVRIENGLNFSNRTYQKLLKAMNIKQPKIYTDDNN